MIKKTKKFLVLIYIYLLNSVFAATDDYSKIEAKKLDTKDDMYKHLKTVLSETKLQQLQEEQALKKIQSELEKQQAIFDKVKQKADEEIKAQNIIIAEAEEQKRLITEAQSKVQELTEAENIFNANLAKKQEKIEEKEFLISKNNKILALLENELKSPSSKRILIGAEKRVANLRALADAEARLKQEAEYNETLARELDAKIKNLDKEIARNARTTSHDSHPENDKYKEQEIKKECEEEAKKLRLEAAKIRRKLVNIKPKAKEAEKILNAMKKAINLKQKQVEELKVEVAKLEKEVKSMKLALEALQSCYRMKNNLKGERVKLETILEKSTLTAVENLINEANEKIKIQENFKRTEEEKLEKLRNVVAEKKAKIEELEATLNRIITTPIKNDISLEEEEETQTFEEAATAAEAKVKEFKVEFEEESFGAGYGGGSSAPTEISDSSKAEPPKHTETPVTNSENTVEQIVDEGKKPVESTVTNTPIKEESKKVVKAGTENVKNEKLKRKPSGSSRLKDTGDINESTATKGTSKSSKVADDNLNYLPVLVTLTIIFVVFFAFVGGYYRFAKSKQQINVNRENDNCI